jgi:hypothetical protein
VQSRRCVRDARARSATLRWHHDCSVGNLVETTDRLGRNTPNASLRYQGQVNGRAVEIADALSSLAAGSIDPRGAALAIA